ncbi:TQO small subunit DoxD [Acidisoma sp. 7E03]
MSLFLMIGLFTRAAGASSIGLSFVLMLLFGWQAATCIDE